MKNYSIEIKWALRFTLLTLAWAIGEKLTGLHDAHVDKYNLYSIFFIIPAALFYFLAINEKKKHFFNGSMSWSQGFVSGVILSFFIALLNPFAQYAIFEGISPDFFHKIIEYKIKNGNIPLKNAQSYFSIKTIMLVSTFTYLSMGIVAGAIISYFLKNKSDE